jgi:hypothetical protein
MKTVLEHLFGIHKIVTKGDGHACNGRATPWPW